MSDTASVFRGPQPGLGRLDLLVAQDRFVRWKALDMPARFSEHSTQCWLDRTTGRLVFARAEDPPRA